MEWPNSCDVNLCRHSWLEATPEERQLLCLVEGDLVILNLRLAEELLSTKLAHTTAVSAGDAPKAVALAKFKSGMSEVSWNVKEQPRTAMLSLRFCAEPEALDAMLMQCTGDYQEYLEIMAGCYAKQNLVKLLQQRCCRGWEGLATTFFTVLLAQMVTRCRKRLTARGRMDSVFRVLDEPAAAPKLRSWPSKRVLDEVRKSWALLAPAERVRACRLEGAAVWYIRACDLAIGTQALRRANDLSAAAQYLSEHQRLRIDALLGLDCDSEPVLTLHETFAAESGCLEHLLRHASHCLSERARLLAAAQDGDALLASAAQAERSPGERASPSAADWAGLVRVVSTLMLDSYLRWQVQERTRAQEAAECLAAKLQQQACKQQRKQKRKATKSETLAPEARPSGASGAQEALSGLRHFATRGAASPSKAALRQLPWHVVDYWVHHTFIWVDESAAEEPRKDFGRMRRCLSSMW